MRCKAKFHFRYGLPVDLAYLLQFEYATKATLAAYWHGGHELDMASITTTPKKGERERERERERDVILQFLVHLPI